MINKDIANRILKIIGYAVIAMFFVFAGFLIFADFFISRIPLNLRIVFAAFLVSYGTFRLVASYNNSKIKDNEE